MHPIDDFNILLLSSALTHESQYVHEHALAHLLLMSEPILSSDIAIAGSHGIIIPQCDGFDANTSTFYTDSTCYYGLSNLNTNLGAASAAINCFAQNASSIVGSPWLIAGYSTNATNITDTTHNSETLVLILSPSARRPASLLPQ